MTLLKKIGNYIWSRHFLINFVVLLLIYWLIINLFQCTIEKRTHLGQKIEVPNLIGKNQNNLENLFAGSQLKYEVLDSIYDPAKVAGTILEQDPAPTELSNVYVKQGRKIKVRVSKRTQLVEMPNLVDKSQRFAENILLSRGFRYSLEYKPTMEAHGAVLGQEFKGKRVAAGTKIPIGSRIKLIVGRNEGGMPQALPNLYGLTIVEAKQRIANMQDMEFQVICDGCTSRTDSLKARVVSQSPEFSEGAIVASGTTITIIANKDFQERQPE